MNSPEDKKRTHPPSAAKSGKQSAPDLDLPDSDLCERLASLPKKRIIDLLLNLCRKNPPQRQELIRNLTLENDQGNERGILTEHETDIRYEGLLMLGRRKEAFDLLWNTFRETLNPAYLQRALALASPSDRTALEAEALRAAVQHNDADLALGFLTRRGAYDRMAELVEQRSDELCQNRHDGLEAVANNLADTHPEQAWDLMRLLLVDILETDVGNESDDENAEGINLIASMSQLAAKGSFEKGHQAFLQQLRMDFKRKKHFWELASLSDQPHKR